MTWARPSIWPFGVARRQMTREPYIPATGKHLAIRCEVCQALGIVYYLSIPLLFFFFFEIAISN